MLTSLYTAVSGMDANGTALSVIGDNIANMNTIGFKASTISFGDVLSQNLSGAGIEALRSFIDHEQAVAVDGEIESVRRGLE